jgi:hypothetical protein
MNSWSDEIIRVIRFQSRQDEKRPVSPSQVIREALNLLPRQSVDRLADQISQFVRILARRGDT